MSRCKVSGLKGLAIVSLTPKLDFIHLKLEPFWAVPGLQIGSQTFSGIQRLTDIKKSLEKI